MKILVVESSRMNRQIIREELEGVGFEVAEAESARDAFYLMENEKIDLVTLAVELPDGSGYEVCQQMLSESENGSGTSLPVVFITGKDRISERARGLEAGALDFITKPFAPGYVGGVVRQILMPENHLEGMVALVVDDSSMTRRILIQTLESRGVQVLEAENGNDAFRIASTYHNDLDLILTDLIMPGMQGDELVRKIRADLLDHDLPIIVMSGEDHNLSLVEIFHSGASDYISKPFIKEELLARISVHLKNRLFHKQLLTKIRELEQVNLRLNQLATRDTLTGLPNRKALFDRFDEAILRKESEKAYLSFVIVDIDYFKRINDSLGHETGDRVITELGQIVRAAVGKRGLIGRLGGEEFGLVVLSRERESGLQIAERIRRLVEQTHFLKDQETRPEKVTTSIGVHISPPGEMLDSTQIYRLADEQLYRAKQEGRNRVCFNGG